MDGWGKGEEGRGTRGGDGMGHCNSKVRGDLWVMGEGVIRAKCMGEKIRHGDEDKYYG